MAVTLPHIEDSTRTLYMAPKGEFETFSDESHYAEKVKEWGLSAKREFWYKEETLQRLVTIKGYEVYGVGDEYNTIVIEFQDGNLSCIHPAYLKEMQSNNYGKQLYSRTDKEEQVPTQEKEIPSTPVPTKGEKSAVPEEKTAPKIETVKKEKAKKEKAAKLDLPDEKVHFTATVKQFAKSWNHFNEEHDEVVVLENVIIEQENPIEVGLAWCSHSKTLKKFEISRGDKLEFDGKIAKKKLPKGKDVEEEFIVEDAVLYKVNNPSKIMKS